MKVVELTDRTSKEPLGITVEGVLKFVIAQVHVGLTVKAKPYNPTKSYQPGDKVLVQRGKKMVEVTVPKVDADGNPYE